MNNIADEFQIQQFIANAKELMFKNKYTFIPRTKNLQSLAQNGLTVDDVKDVILELNSNDYYKGPKPDFDSSHQGDIWEFKKNFDGIQFYVKLKIENDCLKCISFHEDDFLDNSRG